MKYAITCDGIAVETFEHVLNLSPQTKQEILKQYAKDKLLFSIRGLEIIHLKSGFCVLT